MSLKYEPASEPLHICVKYNRQPLTLNPEPCTDLTYWEGAARSISKACGQGTALWNGEEREREG